jgi:hypothetical protein
LKRQIDEENINGNPAWVYGGGLEKITAKINNEYKGI